MLEKGRNVEYTDGLLHRALVEESVMCEKGANVDSKEEENLF